MADEMWRIFLDLHESFAAAPTGQCERTYQVISARVCGGMPDAHHEDDAGLLGNYPHGSGGTDHLFIFPEDAYHMRFALCKELLQRESAARVPHVCGHEARAALRACPQRSLAYQRHDVKMFGRSM